MTRIMLNSLLCACALSTLLLSGCSKPQYKHRLLNSDSEQYRQISALVQQLTGLEEEKLADYMAANAATDLDDARMKGLQYCLLQIAKSSSADIGEVDAFGKQVYRATLILQPQNTTMAMLLVEADNGRLYWAGAN
jgi:outer membrane murein-binding lipoprotein Lpp